MIESRRYFNVRTKTMHIIWRKLNCSSSWIPAPKVISLKQKIMPVHHICNFSWRILFSNLFLFYRILSIHCRPVILVEFQDSIGTVISLKKMEIQLICIFTLSVVMLCCVSSLCFFDVIFSSKLSHFVIVACSNNWRSENSDKATDSRM